jgi:S1-C subfamily serine protease
MSKPAPGGPLQQFSDALADVAAQAAQNVVAVHSKGSCSSGFFWRPGMIITADEALAEEGDISVILQDGKKAAATILGRDPTTDLALLRIDRDDPPGAQLQFATARVGALALAIGMENGSPIASFGSVSFVGGGWRSLRGGEIDARIELGLSLRRSGEGGLAIDASGGALGMVVLGPRRKVLVIPAATIDRVAAKLQTHGRIARGYIGLGLQTAKLDGDSGIGAIVMSVDSKGPGSAAGARQGDVLIKWNGERIQDVRALLRGLGPESVGLTAKLSLLRGGQPIEVYLTIGQRPAS